MRNRLNCQGANDGWGENRRVNALLLLNLLLHKYLDCCYGLSLFVDVPVNELIFKTWLNYFFLVQSIIQNCSRFLQLDTSWTMCYNNNRFWYHSLCFLLTMLHHKRSFSPTATILKYFVVQHLTSYSDTFCETLEFINISELAIYVVICNESTKFFIYLLFFDLFACADAFKLITTVLPCRFCHRCLLTLYVHVHTSRKQMPHKTALILCRV